MHATCGTGVRGDAVIIDLDATCWAHLSTALVFHRRWCRGNAIPVPDDVVRLAEHAKCVTDRQAPTEVRPEVVTAHDVFMTTALAATYADAARRLGVSKRTVERLVAAGSLPSVDVGGVRRIRVADLEGYVASLTSRVGPFRDDITTKEASS